LTGQNAGLTLEMRACLLVAGDVNMQNQTGHSRSAGYSYLEENVTTMKLHIQDSATSQ